MYLRKVKLFGFKSFADRTELELDPRLIAIVGPNGCGKSNIVDAILWALGEHNPRALRAAAASDIIFSGSTKRKCLGYAEVRLLFDNEDGALAYPAPEVAVTRRVTQGGEGEYFINGKPCRQRDIVALFADTGIGRTGYSIVGQREVDAVLSAQPEQRRLLIDEAAGVQKFRTRKEETLKRLDAASRHLQRAEDLLAEIDRQIHPLERQAQAAHAYRAARARLEELELNVLLGELRRQTEKLQELDASVDELSTKSQALARELADRERTATQIAAGVVDAEKELDHRRNLQQGAFTQLERAESTVALTEERLNSLRQLLQTEEEQAEAARAARERLAGELEECRRRRIEIEQRIASLPEDADEARIAELRAELAATRERIAAARRAQLEAQQREAERRQGVLELCRLREEHAETLRQREHLAAEAAERARVREDLRAAFDRAAAAHRQAVDSLRGLREERQRATEALAGVTWELAAVEAKAAALEQGIPGDAAGELLERTAGGDLKLPLERLAKSLRVEKRYRAAIDAAFGRLDDIVVTDRAEDAERILRLLSEEQMGRGAVISRGARGPGAEGALREEARAAGALGLASDLVECAEADAPVVTALLGGVVVFDRWEEAVRAAERIFGWWRIVTLQGEALDPSGALEAGQRRGRVAVEAELRELRDRASALQTELNALGERLSKADADTVQAERAESAAVAEAETARSALTEAVRAADAAAQSLASATADVEKLERRITAMGAKWESGPDADDEHEDPEELERAATDLQRALATLEADRAHSESDRAGLEQRRDEEGDREARVVSQLADLDSQAEERAQRILDLSRRLEQTEADLAAAAAERETAAETRRDADAAFETSRLHRADLLERSFSATEEAKALRAERERIGNERHELDLARARADIRRAQILQTVTEQYELSHERALERAETVEVPRGAPTEVAALRRELRNLGEVNLGAVEALDELRRRREDMTDQREDLLQARAEILDAMREIEQATRERFMATFDAVGVAFSALFAKLFEGGDAAIKLSDPEDVTTTGIDIEVQLPGKRRQRLEMLSGGERSLTAIAFLFALLQTKPSPLCILDEVDAALDGRNVERFCSLLCEFAERIQFLVVTHNAVTIEAADIWYGVTMQEPGVSTVIPFGEGARAVVEAAV